MFKRNKIIIYLAGVLRAALNPLDMTFSLMRGLSQLQLIQCEGNFYPQAPWCSCVRECFISLIFYFCRKYPLIPSALQGPMSSISYLFSGTPSEVTP